jgi:hypothetical protein
MAPLGITHRIICIVTQRGNAPCNEHLAVTA